MLALENSVEVEVNTSQIDVSLCSLALTRDTLYLCFPESQGGQQDEAAKALPGQKHVQKSPMPHFLHSFSLVQHMLLVAASNPTAAACTLTVGSLLSRTCLCPDWLSIVLVGRVPQSCYGTSRKFLNRE